MAGETEADLIEERKMAVAVEKNWGVHLVKLPKFYHIDYAVIKDKVVVGYVEFKRRYFNSDRYKTLFLGLKKWIGLVEVNQQAHKPVYLVVQTDDKMLYTRCDGRPLEHTIEGARGAEPEPMVHFEVSEMKEIKPRSDKKWQSVIKKVEKETGR
jgi:hypothetical protein